MFPPFDVCLQFDTLCFSIVLKIEWFKVLHYLFLSGSRKDTHPKMSAKMYVILKCLLFSHVVSGVERTSPSLPNIRCNKGLNKTVRVNRGEDAIARFDFRVLSSSYHWNAKFTWFNREGHEICHLSRESQGGICTNSTFRMRLIAEISEMRISFELKVFRISYRDNGNYFVQSSYNSPCKIFSIFISVQETLPFCKALLINDNEKLPQAVV